MRVLAERLAAAGFHVLRAHYDGTGESAGGDRDPGRVAAWLASVRRAVAALSELRGVEGVGLIGVRAGGALAAEVAAAIDVARLVLWEPSVGSSYAREMEILAASAPQRVQEGEAAPPPDPTRGFVAGGYWLSPETLADLAKLDVEKVAPRGKPEVLLLHRDDRRPSPRLKANLEKHGCDVLQEQHPGHKEMMVLPQKSVVPTAFVERIAAWALERSSAVGGASPPRLALALDAAVDGVRWRPIRFGKGGHLLGVLTEPAEGRERSRPVVLLLTGGVVPRTSGNGSYVELARRLARRGHAVLRMDVACIGESGTPDGSEGNANDAYPPSILADAREGVDLLFSLTSPTAKLWLAGLCSGAYSSYSTMLGEERAAGAFLINPLVFHMQDGGLGARAGFEKPMAMTAVQQNQQIDRYRQLLTNKDAWKKLLSGKANVRHIASVVRSRVETKARATADRVAVRLGKKAKGVAGEISGLLERGVKVSFAISEGDDALAGIKTELGARYDELLRRGMQLRVFRGADHNFNEPISQAELIDWIVETISGRG
jgi:dienelactone hydrolase